LGVEKDEVFLEFDDVRRSIDWVIALGVLLGQLVESRDLSRWQCGNLLVQFGDISVQPVTLGLLHLDSGGRAVRQVDVVCHGAFDVLVLKPAVAGVGKGLSLLGHSL